MPKRSAALPQEGPQEVARILGVHCAGRAHARRSLSCSGTTDATCLHLAIQCPDHGTGVKHLLRSLMHQASNELADSRTKSLLRFEVYLGRAPLSNATPSTTWAAKGIHVHQVESKVA